MIEPLADADVAPLAAELARLPLMQRYRRTAEALTADLAAGLARGDGLLAWRDAAAGAARGLAWFLPGGTLGLGGYLRLLAVVPAAQKRGAGGELLAAFERGVAAVSRHAFLLVSDFNTAAQRFYLGRGYREVGRLPALLVADVDELILWKRLGREPVS